LISANQKGANKNVHKAEYGNQSVVGSTQLYDRKCITYTKMAES